MFRLNRSRSAVVVILLLASLAVLAGAQELQLGRMTFSRAEAAPLRMPVTGSSSFFRRVGGVAFRTVAEGQSHEVVSRLRYNAAAPDGQRLLIDIQSGKSITPVHGDVYDWQLVPTARFALDENGSAVTLFGQLLDDQATTRVRSSGDEIINYHPALDNTLVGLRLFHADILIIRPDAADLFRQGGREILGAGEGEHDRSRNEVRYQRLSEWQAAQARAGARYQSYVVGDLHQRVTFAARGDLIVFTGEPQWAAWKSRHDTPADRARERELVARVNAGVRAYNASLASAKGRGGVVKGSAVARQLSTLSASIESMKAELDRLQTIDEMPAYSDALSRTIRTLDGINPVVYRTLKTVMHYRALFKHYQGRNPPAYQAFVDSLKTVSVAPPVTTPTIQHSSSQIKSGRGNAAAATPPATR